MRDFAAFVTYYNFTESPGPAVTSVRHLNIHQALSRTFLYFWIFQTFFPIADDVASGDFMAFPAVRVELAMFAALIREYFLRFFNNGQCCVYGSVAFRKFVNLSSVARKPKMLR
jgi:hypothetical protein